MKICDIVDLIDKVLPQKMALEGDKVGLQVDSAQNTNKALVCYELTSEVVSEAKKLECKLIIAFHPLIFNPLESISLGERVGRLSSELIRSDISFYSVHTSFDSHPNGSSRLIAEGLGLVNTKILFPNQGNPDWGMGVIGELEQSKDIAEILIECYHIFNSPIKHSRICEKRIKTIAVIAGSGMSWASEILDIAPDIFITADTKYHDYHLFEGKITLLDPGHYEMEQFVVMAIKNILRRAIPEKIKLYHSHSYSNPIAYYPDKNYTIRQKNYLTNI